MISDITRPRGVYCEARMNAHKVVLTIVDLDELGADEIKDVIENQRWPNHCISPDVFSITTADIGEWSDDHPLNISGNTKAWGKVFSGLNDEDLNKARYALGEIEKYNHIRNDLDAYLYEVSQWGLGFLDEKPDPKHFGVA